jgi:hypothetical protein
MRTIKRLSAVFAALAAAALLQATPAAAVGHEGTWLFQNFANGLCADVDNASIDDWARVKQWPCHNWGPQQWRVTVVKTEPPFTYYTLRNAKSGKCLDLPFGDPTQGLIQHSCWNGPMQLWAIESSWAGGDGVRLRNLADPIRYYCLSVDVPAGAGATLTVKPCANVDTQRWRYFA